VWIGDRRGRETRIKLFGQPRVAVVKAYGVWCCELGNLRFPFVKNGSAVFPTTSFRRSPSSHNGARIVQFSAKCEFSATCRLPLAVVAIQNADATFAHRQMRRANRKLQDEQKLSSRFRAFQKRPRNS
jgi:hypothetical protein